MSDLSGKPDFRGAATLTFDKPVAAFSVDIDLRGHSQPIDGRYRWYGRVRPHEALREFMESTGGRNTSGTLRTEAGEAAVVVGDVDFWGRYRLQGTGMPPYPVEPEDEPGSLELSASGDPTMSADDDALQRAVALLTPHARATVDTSAGYAELLGGTPAPSSTAASRAMNNRVVASIYEKLWRPAGIMMMGFGGLSMSSERSKAVADLRLTGNMTVLDAASGPGNFTRHLSESLSGDGVAVGFDISEQMIARAVRDNRGAHAAYMRGDAQALPFADDTFDAVCCYAALYLIPEPLAVVDELVRVLRPGGRIAIMTSYNRSAGPVKTLLSAGAGRAGVRMFDKDTFTSIFERSDMTDIEQDIRGLAQFVSATKAH
ncbi:MAG: DUF4873 domain-containing protein [Rhodococcus sp. (in: high G+C Gram-positive bacteria)]